MSWLKETFSSSLGRKLIMAFTGLFLILFLIGHVIGNLQLFTAHGDNGQAFNEYGKFMTSNPLILTLSITTYLSIILHVIYSIILTIRNKKARPVGYAEANPSANSAWSSRNMGILGTFVLIFIVIHLKGFWYEYKFGNVPMINYGEGEIKDLYIIVVEAFKQEWYVAVYVISMVFLGFHLVHGFKSAFQTLGLKHKKYSELIRTVGIGFAIIVPALFASMPLFIYFKYVVG
jgi:succinate dehydrogenase / fumarate reductase, cytochrome b subunit